MFGSSEQRETAADGSKGGVGGSDREGGEDGLYLTGNAKVDVASSWTGRRRVDELVRCTHVWTGKSIQSKTLV